MGKDIMEAHLNAIGFHLNDSQSFYFAFNATLMIAKKKRMGQEAVKNWHLGLASVILAVVWMISGFGQKGHSLVSWKHYIRRFIDDLSQFMEPLALLPQIMLIKKWAKEKNGKVDTQTTLFMLLQGTQQFIRFVSLTLIVMDNTQWHRSGRMGPRYFTMLVKMVFLSDFFMFTFYYAKSYVEGLDHIQFHDIV